MSARRRQAIPTALLLLLLIPATIVAGVIVPPLGLLLFLLSPLLVPLILVAMLVSLAIEVGTGRVARAWLVLPALWFGGYAALYGFGVHKVHAISSRLDAENAKRSVAFDPATQALEMGEGVDNSALRQFMTAFDVAVIYQQIGAHTDDPRYLATRVADAELCGSVVKNILLYSKMEIAASHPRDDSLCFVTRPEKPDRPLTRISRTWTPSHDLGVKGFVGRITISSQAAQAELELELANVAPISPFPFLLFDPFSQDAGFFLLPQGRQRKYGLLGERDEFALVARTLGLARRAPGVAPTPTAPPLPIEDEWRRAQAVDLESKFDAFLTTPGKRLDRDAVEKLRRRPELIAAHASALVDAALTTLGRSQNAIENQVESENQVERERQFQAYRLVAELSDADFRPFAPRFLAALKASRAPGKTGYGLTSMAQHRVLARLGDLGAESVDSLVDAYFGGSGASFEALIGLCRAGAAAEEAMERIIRLLGNLPDLHELSPQRRRLLAIAALRLGRADLAEMIDEMARRNLASRGSTPEDPPPEAWSGDYARLAATVSPQSAPGACDVKKIKWHD